MLTPKQMLNSGFRGIFLKWKCVANGIQDDGRWLYEIETDTQEHRDVVLEGLQAWGVHLKTLNSAKELVEKLTKRTDIAIISGRLSIKEHEDFRADEL